MPSAFTRSRSSVSFNATAAAAAAPIAPSTAVGWKPALWISFGATRLRAAHELAAHRHAAQRILAGDLFPLADREHRRHDHRAGVHRAALEGVVEVLAVRRGAVDERRAAGVERALVADGGAAAGGFPAVERGAHVVRVARGDAQAGDVDQQLLDDFARRLRRRAAMASASCSEIDSLMSISILPRRTNQMVSAPYAIIAAAMTRKMPCSEASSSPPARTMARRAVPASNGQSTLPAPCEAK